MKKKQFIALFAISLLGWTIGNGLFPVLPVYASKLGANAAQTGNYLCIGYIALTAGTLTFGWLSDKLQRRKLLMLICCALCAPMFWLMGRVTTITSLTVFTAGYFFTLGGAGAVIPILTALFADPAKRGRIFGLLALTAPMGTIIGGMTVGPGIARWGYPVFFSGLAVVFGCLSLLIVAMLEDKPAVGLPSARQASVQKAALGKCFFLFFGASILVSIVNFVGRLGTSLAMNQLGYVVSAISIAGAVGGAAVLPILPTIGWLSDRIGRKQLLAFCYLAGILGLVTLAFSNAQWHFWIVSTLLSVLFYGGSVVGPALVTDIVPKRALGRGISIFNTSSWIGGIVGMWGTGNAVQGFGTVITFGAAALLPLVALVLLFLVKPVQKSKRAATA